VSAWSPPGLWVSAGESRDIYSGGDDADVGRGDEQSHAHTPASPVCALDQ